MPSFKVARPNVIYFGQDPVLSTDRKVSLYNYVMFWWWADIGRDLSNNKSLRILLTLRWAPSPWPWQSRQPKIRQRFPESGPRLGYSWPSQQLERRRPFDPGLPRLTIAMLASFPNYLWGQEELAPEWTTLDMTDIPPSVELDQEVGQQVPFLEN